MLATLLPLLPQSQFWSISVVNFTYLKRFLALNVDQGLRIFGLRDHFSVDGGHISLMRLSSEQLHVLHAEIIIVRGSISTFCRHTTQALEVVLPHIYRIGIQGKLSNFREFFSSPHEKLIWRRDKLVSSATCEKNRAVINRHLGHRVGSAEIPQNRATRIVRPNLNIPNNDKANDMPGDLLMHLH